MDTMLVEAARTGNVTELRNLMEGDPFLFKPAELTGGENPLHIACRCGRVDFVKELLFHNPEFAKELNADGLSPLHIASAYGHVDIVKELLGEVGPHLCLVKAKNSKTALHYAVIRGKTEVMDELISACLRSIKEVTDDGETCFHMAVKHKKTEALEHLTCHVKSLPFGDAMLVLNRGNNQGNTILHLAASRTQQDQSLAHLLLTTDRYLELNALNGKDLTPLDVLISEGGRREVKERLTELGAKHAADLYISWRRMFDYGNTIGKKRVHTMSTETRNTLLVVLALIIASTYQAVISPPGGLWQDTVVTNVTHIPYHDDQRSKVDSSELHHVAGTSIFRTLNPVGFSWYFASNTVGFMTSCALSLYLTAPHHTIVWFALAPLFFTYSISAGMVIRKKEKWLSTLLCILVVVSAATHRLFLSDIYCNRVSNTFSLGKYLYQVVYSRMYKNPRKALRSRMLGK